MQDYEKLGVFYLGRYYDLKKKKSLPELVLYDSRHLVTHGLVVGMTGSGKTGLCFDIIEEAAIDGIPSIVIDPKGDLGNLLLTFPELRPEDFAPWINEDDAQKQGLSVTDFAAQQAQLWRKGLASWDQDGERIRRLRSAADFALYTPGSSAGLPVSILKSFAVPPPEILEDGESLRERVSSTVTGLLGLVGIQADPVKSRETILLANVLQSAWGKGRDLDLAGLIQEVQNPSLQRLGVIDLEAFYPAKDRFELAMQLNNVLASPGFTAWTQGEALDVGRLLHTEGGKPRVAIFSIAHLGDSERMFFVTLLLNQVVSWMRAQSGTNSLRALVYMDEIAGYFPPVANPPSKPPLLALLKQARAFGVGVVLATQNPVDLDYKGLANIGSWFIGRLQTDRDKARVLEGLEGAAAGRGAKFDRAAAEQVLAGLGSRVFLLHDVHEDHSEVFESRWAMSYLRGPLSRAQIKSLTESATERPATSAVPSPPPVPQPPSLSPQPLSGRPLLPPQVPQFFVPVRAALPPGSSILYQPRLLGGAQVRYADTRLRIDMLQDVLAMTEITDSAVPVDWAAAEELAITANELEKNPTEADYAPCAPAASQVKNYANWARDFTTWIQNSRKMALLRSPSLNQFSRPGEAERDFRIRLQQAAREVRDAAAEKLRAKYAPKIAALQERLRRTEAAKEREADQAKRAKLDAVISLGSTLLGAFLGRKAVSVGTVGKAATTMRSAGRAMGQASDVGRAQETVEAVQQQLQDLEAQFQAEVSAATTTADPANETLETVDLRPTRMNINVRLVALVWLPFSRDAVGVLNRAY
jgi:DNA helicase HerA-like ATPase